MEHKVLVGLLLLFLRFSYVHSSRPLPPSAFLKSDNEDLSIQEYVELQGGVMEGIRNYGGRRALELEEAIIRGRINIESNDYAGPGASHRHDPKTPPPYNTNSPAGTKV